MANCPRCFERVDKDNALDVAYHANKECEDRAPDREKPEGVPPDDPFQGGGDKPELTEHEGQHTTEAWPEE